MELEKFITDSLIAIQKGAKNAKVEGFKVGVPYRVSEGATGIEFDIGIRIQDGKIKAMATFLGNTHTRIRFSVPIDKQ